MSNPQDNNGNGSGDNPKWQPILDALPPEFHSIIKPTLKEWDAGVTRRFQEIHAEYEPYKKYKEFVENDIDFDYAKQAVILADELQRDAKGTVAKINEGWNLGYLTPEQAQELQQQQVSNSDNDEFDFTDDSLAGLENHPQFKAMKQALDQLNETQAEQRAREEQEAALEEFESSLDALEQSVTDPNREGGPLPFNRLFVTALMNQGLSGEDAVAEYHKALAGNSVTQINSEQDDSSNSDNQPPVVMGGGGSGSGTPDNPIDFGALSKNDTNKLVEDLIRQAAESGN